jgi:NAD(P)-dependent dehydrogenase (short-subunit alcohol dehydrogenase family)
LLHARNKEKAEKAFQKNPEAEGVVIADLSDIQATIHLANDVNSYGDFDAVIHNAGVYQASSKDIIHVNILAPYILTCLINKPSRLIYLSSNMHRQGNSKLNELAIQSNRINYSDSKLHVLMLSQAVARRWSNVFSNAVDPGWVPTKMGGAGAPDDLQKGYETQVWLATSEDPQAKVTGRYFYHKVQEDYNFQANNQELQEQFLQTCESLTGIIFPKVH